MAMNAAINSVAAEAANVFEVCVIFSYSCFQVPQVIPQRSIRAEFTATHLGVAPDRAIAVVRIAAIPISKFKFGCSNGDGQLQIHDDVRLISVM